MIGCSSAPEDPCTRFFEPYPDLVSGRMRHRQNAALVDAMKAYSAGDHATAITGLERYMEQGAEGRSDARIYLASSYLAVGRPYDAEFQLDQLERSPNKSFAEVVEWYDALCWLCSGQFGRALEQARSIAARPRHTYKEQAVALMEDLEGR
ncbi:MAG: tetratricopeptide repeat protein [Flavobacteriales bacterium]|nr:tetratricopeptide repeat protein [Flavobacteriales bacterium]